MATPIDKIINRLGIYLLRELHAIAWSCDATVDGKMALIPSSRTQEYERGGRLHALVETGCIKPLKSTYMLVHKRRMPAVRVEPIGRTVLCLCAAKRIDLRSADTPSAA